MAYGKPDKKIHKLTDLEVHEVSIVDRPANLRRFLMVKNKEEQGVEVEPDENGNLITKPVIDVEKKGHLAVDPQLKTEAFGELPNTIRRLDSVLMTIDFSANAESGQTTSLQSIIGKELSEIASVVGDIAKKFGVKKEDVLPDSTEKHLADFVAKHKPADKPKMFDNPLQGLVEILEQEVQKGHTMSTEAETLEAVRNLLEKIAEPLKEEETVAEEVTKAKGDEAPEVITKALEDFGGVVEQLKKQLEEKDAKIDELEKTQPVSNVAPAETVEVEKGEEDNSWPQDMNSEANDIVF